MILEETVNKFTRDVIDLLLLSSGFAIKAEQLGAPRPAGAYADVKLVSDTGIGWEYFSSKDRVSDLDIDFTSKGLRELMLSVGFYRTDAMDNARKVQLGFARESVQALFVSANMGLIRRSEVRTFSEVLENGWEERAQFDIFFSAIGTDLDIVRSIQSLNIAGEFQARGLSYNFNIEVP